MHTQHHPRFDELVVSTGAFENFSTSLERDCPVGNKGTALTPSLDQEALKRAFCQAVRERRAKAHAYYLERSFLDDRDLVSERIRAVVMIAILMVVCAAGFSMKDEVYFQLGF